jgi:DNA-binding response OmpR family regulator
VTLKLLIADDAADVAEVIAFGARMTWPDCQITIASDGAQAISAFAADPPDLVVLDVTMPAPDGFEVCRRIRASSRVPILMLTVRDATLDKVRALDLGADDYLTKPFDHLELLARLRALLRRADVTPAIGVSAIAFLRHDMGSATVFNGELARTDTRFSLSNPRAALQWLRVFQTRCVTSSFAAGCLWWTIGTSFPWLFGTSRGRQMFYRRIREPNSWSILGTIRAKIGRNSLALSNAE